MLSFLSFPSSLFTLSPTTSHQYQRTAAQSFSLLVSSFSEFFKSLLQNCLVLVPLCFNQFLYLLNFQKAIHNFHDWYFFAFFSEKKLCLFGAYLFSPSLFPSSHSLSSSLFSPPPDFTSIFNYQCRPLCPSLHFSFFASAAWALFSLCIAGFNPQIVRFIFDFYIPHSHS